MGKYTVCFLVAMALFVGVASAETVIICNPGVHETALPQKALRNIFLGKTTQWGDHSKINMVVLKDAGRHQAFLKAYVHRTPSQWRRHWKKMVFTGKGIKPRQFDDTGAYLAYIADTPGAVGYIDKSLANETVKILTVK